MQAEVRNLFEGFSSGSVAVGDDSCPVDIPYVSAGTGPPLLLLHGAPQTKAMWHRVAPRLAEHFTVVATDLRGYGDASKPEGGKKHQNYSKRAMAADQLAVMQALGHSRFMLAGHDRGARVAHRLALDHPQAVSKLMVLDIAPTLSMFEQTDMNFATAYWHWFFYQQKAPLPEKLVGADPEFMLRTFMGGRHAGLSVFDPAAWSEYLRCAKNPAMLHAMCEDYRAAASIDLEHDRIDRSNKVVLEMPVRVLWGEYGLLHRCFDPIKDWRAFARQVEGRLLPCGHYIAEELPDVLVPECLEFFGSEAV